MRRHDTRACNFYYGKESKLLVSKQKTLPLNNNNEISFDHLEIISRKSKKKISIKEINNLPKFNILLIFDEVQCGFLRSGKMFAHQWADIEPDIMTTAKAIANGFPLGATMTSKKVGDVMHHGTHGSTYGGNPLAVAVGNAVLDIMQKEIFLENLKKVSSYFLAGLKEISNKFPDSTFAYTP